MSRLKSLLIAAPVAAGLLSAPAYADWHGHGDYHGHGDWHGAPPRGGWHDHDHGNGGAIAGALLGLGAAAVIGGVLASQAAPPPVVYQPPPAYYPPPPAYYPPPGYAPGYYPPPGY